jgi:large subunit ribosomal protein L25
MADDSTTVLSVTSREPNGSRDVRRLRRGGAVPGVLYGGGEDPVAFAVDGHELRHALQHAGALIDLQLDGAAGTPVVLKELVRHPVTAAYTHLDLMRVRLDQAIQTQVTLELTGADDAPGVREGGVLEQVLREVTIEALPTAIPDTIPCDVSSMQIGDTLTLAAAAIPDGVTIVTDAETTVASLIAPRLQTETEDEIETETEVVGEGGEPAAESDGDGDE